MSNDAVVIVSGARTPMGGLQGSLSAVTAVELGTTAIKAAVERAGIKPELIDEAIIGNVLSAGLRQGPARQAVLNAGLSKSTGCVTINKLCGSGMQAAMYAHDLIKAGSAKCVIAGGMESMSNAPHIIMNARSGVRTGHQKFLDHMFWDGLEDASTSRMMGSFAQDTADKNNLTREDMDAFAIESLKRAQNAINGGLLADEIAAVTIKTRKGETIVKDDEQPLTAKIDKIPSLRPAFSKDGTITAANASSISDGASALVLMSESEAKAQGITPLARIVGHARHSQEPADFTIAPIGAMQKLFDNIGWSKDDVDLFEINEAFAMVTMLAIRDFDLDPAKVNIYGGACAQGHPIGSTGSRLLVTLMYALQKEGKKKGVASLCIGGGEATAMAIELI
ncbi:MAG: acetyl-CoA C-acyltransferase [Pseudomonadales bacterium]|nr:acetyl-CoA C-acyltransferase [Pseudomonadales bacterium]